MAQVPSPACPRCHAQVVAGQRFCTVCGANTDKGISRHPAPAPDRPGYAQYPRLPVQQPAPQPFARPGYPSQAPQGFPQMQQGYQQPPAFAQLQKGAAKNAPGQRRRKDLRKTSLIKVALFAIALFANINYLLFILNPVHADNLGFFIMTGIADTIAIVIFVSTWATALYFELCKPRYYREIAELRQKGSYLLRRKVAVLVTVVNEDSSIVRNTLESAKALIGEKEIYLLDDGRNPATQALAAQLGVRYITRENNVGFKAGNLNNALRRHVAEDFVLVVDADFALHPDFLQRTLPLFHDPRIAAVQTPQVYSNTETLFAKGSKYFQNIFYTYLQPGKHLLDSAFCVGTNVIFRKQALADVGGIVETHSEDIFTTIKLLERGYKVAFLNEPLAVGLSPTTLISFYTQQYRWARGGMLMLMKHNTLFNRRLHPEQRLQFFLANFFYFSGISVIIYLISPLLAILLNVKPLNDASFEMWLPTYALFFCTNFLFFLAFTRKHRLQSVMLGIFSFVPYMNAFFSEFLGWRKYKWKTTNSRSKGLITKLLSPYIIYLAIAAAIAYFLGTGILSFNPGLVMYYAWLAIDVLIVATFLVQAYAATSKVTIPVLEEQEQYTISTAELLAEKQQTGKLVSPQPMPQPQTKRGPQLNGEVEIDHLPTRKLAFLPGGETDRRGRIDIDDMPTLNVPLLNREARN